MALIEKYLVNNIQCIAEKIAAEMRTSLLAHHVAEFPAKKTTTTKRNANIAGCVSCRSAGSRNQRLNQTADLDCELSGAMADFGVVLNSSDSTAPEFGLWRVGRTELADYSLDRTSSRLPVTWSAMKTSTHSCSAACSRQNGRQQSRLYMKNQWYFWCRLKSIKVVKFCFLSYFWAKILRGLWYFLNYIFHVGDDSVLFWICNTPLTATKLYSHESMIPDAWALREEYKSNDIAL